jgi:DNA uptake protein ComE-like DNA-binding protein
LHKIFYFSISVMKEIFKSYTSFTRAERLGIFALCSLLVILIIVKATMYLWVHPKVDEEQNKKLVAAWEVFKRSQPVTDTTGATKKEYQDAYDEQATPLPDTININTADSATLVRLKGIGPVTAGKIVARRNKHPFTSVEQLSDVGSFSDSTFAMLKRHLTVK